MVRESGLIAPGSRGIVLVSGGGDSAATAAALVEVLGTGAVTALHLNYGLRPDSDSDEEIARAVAILEEALTAVQSRVRVPADS